jgi:hypothetical protein
MRSGRSLTAGSNEFADLPANRGFINELVGRANARFSPRIEIERTVLQDLPLQRTTDYREAIHSLRCKLMTLMGLVYCDKLSPLNRMRAPLMR